MLEYNLKQTLIKFWNKAKQTFALKVELAQPDWNQNDDTQPDYINNRTHWEEPEIYNEAFRGENLNYTTSGNLTTYQVNSNIPILSEGRHYELNIGEYKFDGICKKFEDVAGSYGYYIGNGSISIQGEPDTGEDFIVYTSGRALSSPEIMWFIMKNDSPSGEYDTLLALHEGGVHRLDKKFLPDDIGVQGDWDENDTESPSHILNRTHYVIQQEETETLLDEESIGGDVEATTIGEGPYSVTGYYMDVTLVAGIRYRVSVVDENGFVFADDKVVEAVTMYAPVYGTPWSGPAEFREQVVIPIYGDVSLENPVGLAAAITEENGLIIINTPDYDAYSNQPFTVTLKEITQEEEVQQLDEKFLPETKKYQGDWDESNEDSPNFIKNKTHYDYGSTAYEMVPSMSIGESGMHFTKFHESIETVKGLDLIWEGKIHSSSNDMYGKVKCTWTTKPSEGWNYVIDVYRDGQHISSQTGFGEYLADEYGNELIGEMVINAKTTQGEYGGMFSETGIWSFDFDYEEGVSPEIHPTISLYKNGLKQLDKKYIPVDVQGDWNQDDDTQIDYIKNRTHYAIQGDVTPAIGQIVYDESEGSGYFIKISDEITTPDKLYTKTIYEDWYWEMRWQNGVLVENDYDSEGELSYNANLSCIENNGNYIIFDGDSIIAFIINTSDETFTETGFYVPCWGDETEGTYPTYELKGATGAKKLDKIYLPDDVTYNEDLAPVATSGDYNDLENTPTKLSDFINDGNGGSPLAPFVTADEVAQSDWEQNDENAPDFIKNKICYEKTETLRGYSNTDTDYITTDEWNFYSIPDIDENFVDSFVGRTISFEYGYEGERQSWNAEVQSAESPETAGDLYKWPSENIYAVYGPEDYDWIVFILEDNTEIYGTTFNKGIIILNYLYGDCNYTVSNKIITTIKKIDEKFIPDTIARVNDIPTKTSDLINDGSDGISAYVEGADLAPVATSGDYGDLLNTPTKLSDFINDGNGGSPADPFITDSEVSAVGKSGDYGDLLNTPTKLSDFINDGNGDSPSNPFATEADIEEIQDVMSPLASNQNKLISQSEAQDLVNTLSLSPIMADSTGQKSFDFESQMYSALVPGSTNLEAGPWYKNEGNGFVACNSTTGVYVSLNDSADVTNDESLFFYFAHGYRYQRVKMGVQGVYGQIKTPYGETVNLIYTDGSSLSGKFANVPCIYFYDDHNLFGHTGRVIYVCRASNLVSKTNAAEEYLMAAGETIDDIVAGADPDNVTDLIYPTTKYVCTQAQTASTDPVWSFRVIISETTFTTAEWEAIRSEITREKVAQIDANKQAIESLADVAFSGDYDDLDNKLEVEVSQSAYGTNPKYKRTTITVNGTSTNVDVPTVDAELSPSSKNPVQNNVIQHELSTKLSADRFNELDNKALTTDGIKTGIILEPDVTITTGKWYPVYPVVNDYQWKMGVADNDTHFKIYDVSDYDVVHLQAVSRIGYILTDSLPTDFESRVTTTGSGNIWEYNEPSGTAPGTHSEQAVMQPRSGYDIFNGDIITNGRPYLIVYEGNSAQALVVSYGGGYTPITTSMFINDGEGGSPVDKFAKVSELPTKTSDLINDGEGGSPSNPFLKSSDMEASQSDWNYIMGN